MLFNKAGQPVGLPSLHSITLACGYCTMESRVFDQRFLLLAAANLEAHEALAHPGETPTRLVGQTLGLLGELRTN